MKKSYAIQLLGGTGRGNITRAARVLGCYPQAITNWGEELSDAIAAKVEVAYNRLKKRKGLPDLEQINKDTQ